MLAGNPVRAAASRIVQLRGSAWVVTSYDARNFEYSKSKRRAGRWWDAEASDDALRMNVHSLHPNAEFPQRSIPCNLPRPARVRSPDISLQWEDMFHGHLHLVEGMESLAEAFLESDLLLSLLRDPYQSNYTCIWSLLEEFSPETIGAEMVAWEAA